MPMVITDDYSYVAKNSNDVIDELNNDVINDLSNDVINHCCYSFKGFDKHRSIGTLDVGTCDYELLYAR